MALIKFGGGVVQMSGSIAGNTFARNRYGNYVRARTKPVNPRSLFQQAVRTAMTEMTTRWSQTLTPVQRTAWNLYASSVNMLNRLGETINLTGFNHYIRSNTIRSRSSLALVDDGPTLFEIPEADGLFAFTASEATQLITVTFDDSLDWNDETGAFMFIFQGTPQNTQRNFFNGPWRLIGHFSGVDAGGPVGPTDIVAQFAVAAAQRMWLYARIQRADGRLSQPFRVHAWIDL